MKKSEIFDLIVEKVCEVCEVRRDSVLAHCKLQSVVDARVLAVQYLRRTGLSNDDVALLVMRANADDATLCPPIADVKQKAKNIDKLFKGYSDRCLQSYAFCLMSRDIAQYCRDTYSEMYVDGMRELPRK